jgi:hypothetical protein
VSSTFANTLKGQQITPIDPKLKLLYFRFILNDDKIKEPKILFGVFYDINVKGVNKESEKFERYMAHFEYVDSKFFSDHTNEQYEDAYIRLSRKVIERTLFDIKDSLSIKEKIVDPVLDIYRSINQ